MMFWSARRWFCSARSVWPCSGNSAGAARRPCSSVSSRAPSATRLRSTGSPSPCPWWGASPCPSPPSSPFSWPRSSPRSAASSASSPTSSGKRRAYPLPAPWASPGSSWNTPTPTGSASPGFPFPEPWPYGPSLSSPPASWAPVSPAVCGPRASFFPQPPSAAAGRARFCPGFSFSPASPASASFPSCRRRPQTGRREKTPSLCS